MKTIRILYIIILMTAFSHLNAQSWEKNIPAKKLIEWRRYIHQNPELSFNELRTAKYVEGILRKLGNIDIKKPSKTSVIGILKGASSGKKVAFRADMDALPIQEETGLPFASVNKGVMHACGHDGHTAMLLATATTLSKMQKQLKGTVYFIFQHAEEKHPGGALEIIESGLLNDVEAFFGVHLMPNLPVGTIGILPDGAASTAADAFYLTINGKGSHGSMPQRGIDPIVIGAEIVNSLQTIVSRNVPPGEMAVISVGKFQSGNAPNVIPSNAELAATIRTTTSETRKLIEKRIKSIIENITKMHGATYELDYILGYPSIQNNATLNAKVKQSAINILGDKNVQDVPRIPASEDFSYYNKIAPTCFMTLGIGYGPANHNPKFNPDENALINGVKAEVKVILDYLNN